MKPVIIIGAGMAGYTVARELRKLDKTMPLSIVTADDGGFYSKPMLSNALALGKSAQQLKSQTAEQMATQLDASIIANTRVLEINAADKTISTTSSNMEYAALVLAVGAAPIRLPLDGDAAGQVLSVNHLDHYATFRSMLANNASIGGKRVAILGAGLIGCEFADDLSSAGHQVTLIDPNPVPLAALAPPALSRGMALALAGRGVNLQLGTTVKAVNQAANVLELQLANGESLMVDMVLSAVGLRPDLNLANASGLAIRRGIVVDRYGQTSSPGIYAVGDCAEYSHEDGSTSTLPYIAPLMSAARAIARTLSGTVTTISLPPAPVIVKTPSYPLAILPPPLHAASLGQWRHSDTENGGISRFHDEQGNMAGFAASPHDSAIRQRLLAELGKPAGLQHTVATTVN